MPIRIRPSFDPYKSADLYYIICAMFRTLEDLKKKEEKPDSSKKTVDNYTGGESSGIAVQAPDSQKKLASIVEKAKK
jgi:hypothetical protein